MTNKSILVGMSNSDFNSGPIILENKSNKPKMGIIVAIVVFVALAVVVGRVMWDIVGPHPLEGEGLRNLSSDIKKVPGVSSANAKAVAADGGLGKTLWIEVEGEAGRASEHIMTTLYDVRGVLESHLAEYSYRLILSQPYEAGVMKIQATGPDNFGEIVKMSHDLLLELQYGAVEASNISYTGCKADYEGGLVTGVTRFKLPAPSCNSMTRVWTSPETLQTLWVHVTGTDGAKTIALDQSLAMQPYFQSMSLDDARNDYYRIKPNADMRSGSATNEMVQLVQAVKTSGSPATILVEAQYEIRFDVNGDFSIRIFDNIEPGLRPQAEALKTQFE